jgi:hypothetical protein
LTRSVLERHVRAAPQLLLIPEAQETHIIVRHPRVKAVLPVACQLDADAHPRLGPHFGVAATRSLLSQKHGGAMSVLRNLRALGYHVLPHWRAMPAFHVLRSPSTDTVLMYEMQMGSD